jgi:bifunctional non-homologous end joining protein LigD
MPAMAIRFVEAMALLPVRQLPQGAEWLYEVKLDGYRALILKSGEQVEIRSRNDRDLTRSYPRVAEAAKGLKARSAVVDGEIVALGPEGRPAFQALQHRGSHPNHRTVFYAFDLLNLDGKELPDEPLTRRKAMLSKVLAGSELLLSQELPGRAADIFEAARALGLEGVVAKRRDSAYEPGERSGVWQKLKLELSQEFVVGGYRPGSARSTRCWWATTTGGSCTSPGRSRRGSWRTCGASCSGSCSRCTRAGARS